jgi:hypothetical protein
VRPPRKRGDAGIEPSAKVAAPIALSTVAFEKEEERERGRRLLDSAFGK